MKKKNINTMYLEDNTEVEFVELPEGYFYKGHFYTESKMFTVLKKEKEVGVKNFYNGIWKYNYYCFTSLEELYEHFEDEISMSYKELKYHYKEIGVYHNPKNCTMYFFYEDDDQQLYCSKDNCLSEMREQDLLESETDRENDYLDSITDDECRAYLKKPIKERIKILEEYKR